MAAKKKSAKKTVGSKAKAAKKRGSSTTKSTKKAKKKTTTKTANKKAGKKAEPKSKSRVTAKAKAKAKVEFPLPERNGDALRARILRITEALGPLYGDEGTALHSRSPFELIVATVLSAQSTDGQVNKVTPALFRAYSTPQALAAAPTEKVEELVHSTGFYRQKTKSIQALSKDLVERFGGGVPVEMEDLTSLRGVGRKTANCVRAMAFGLPGIIVDTHFKRLVRRMGLVDTADPDKIEAQICALLPPEQWTKFSNAMIWHGRATCDARKPDCENCPILRDCPSGPQILMDRAG